MFWTSSRKWFCEYNAFSIKIFTKNTVFKLFSFIQFIVSMVLKCVIVSHFRKQVQDVSLLLSCLFPLVDLREHGGYINWPYDTLLIYLRQWSAINVPKGPHEKLGLLLRAAPLSLQKAKINTEQNWVHLNINFLFLKAYCCFCFLIVFLNSPSFKMR